MRIVITSNGSAEIRSLSIPRTRTNKTITNSPKAKKKSVDISLTPSPDKVIPSNLKKVKIAAKKLNLPPMMQDKYSESQSTNNYLSEDQEQSRLLPDVLMSIEKSIDQSQSLPSKLPIIRQSYPIKYIINPKLIFYFAFSIIFLLCQVLLKYSVIIYQMKILHHRRSFI